jgi:copper chaperone
MTTVKIKGMSCHHCVMAVTKALKDIAGIQDLSVDLGKAEARFNELTPVDKELVKERIRKAGYEVVS